MQTQIAAMVVGAHIDELRREAAVARVARKVRKRGPAQPGPSRFAGGVGPRPPGSAGSRGRKSLLSGSPVVPRRARTGAV